MQYNWLTNGDTIRGFILSLMNESASLLLMEYPVNVWKQSETKHNELVHVNGQLVWPEMRGAALCDVSPFLCCSYCFAGMHDEGAGGEVQAARPSGGSHAESAEVSPATQGKSAQHVAHRHPWAATGACSCSGNSPGNNVNNTTFMQKADKVICHVPATLASFPVLIIALH